MTRRQWAYLPVFLLVTLLIPVGCVLALAARLFFYLLRLIYFLHAVYVPSAYVPAGKCTIPPDDHGLTCNGYPCDMVQEKFGLDEWGTPIIRRHPTDEWKPVEPRPARYGENLLDLDPDEWSAYHEFRARTDPPPWGRGEDD